jgi:hypothetical protein
VSDLNRCFVYYAAMQATNQSRLILTREQRLAMAAGRQQSLLTSDRYYERHDAER